MYKAGPRDDGLVTVAEAAELLDRSEVTVRRWQSDGRLRSRRVLGRILFERSEVERVRGAEQIPAASGGSRRRRRAQAGTR